VTSSEVPTRGAQELDWFARVRRKRLVTASPYVIVSALLLGAWLALVIFVTTRHEYWRDEIRPWSLAGAAHSPVDLFHRIRYEGHPILWYLILYVGRSLDDTPLVLPMASIAIAAAAMAIFVLRAPFPLWMEERCWRGLR
jgi:hypothetical protein